MASRHASFFLAAAIGFGMAFQASAGPASANAQWITPVVHGYGAIHPRPDAAVQPDPKADYKLFVHVASEQAPKDPRKALGKLERLARLVNLMGASGVPRAHLHIVALLDQAALEAAFTDEAYRQATGAPHNPNLPLLHALHEAGVQLLVCSQALAGAKLPDNAVSPDVTVTLSALTDMAVYGQRGYAYMQW